MTTYKVYQINPDKIETEAQREAKWDSMDAKINETNIAMYEHVANVEAENMEHAFELLNMWNDESKVTRFAQMHSLSTGDILVEADGTAFVCASIGFDIVADEFQIFRTTLLDVKNGAEVGEAIYVSSPYVVKKYDIVLDAGTLDELKTLSSYYDDCVVSVRKHDLYLNDNTKVVTTTSVVAMVDEAFTPDVSVKLDYEGRITAYVPCTDAGYAFLKKVGFDIFMADYDEMLRRSEGLTFEVTE